MEKMLTNMEGTEIHHSNDSRRNDTIPHSCTRHAKGCWNNLQQNCQRLHLEWEKTHYKTKHSENLNNKERSWSIKYKIKEHCKQCRVAETISEPQFKSTHMSILSRHSNQCPSHIELQKHKQSDKTQYLPPNLKNKHKWKFQNSLRPPKNAKNRSQIQSTL